MSIVVIVFIVAVLAVWAFLDGKERFKRATRPGWEDQPPTQPDARSGLR